MAAEKTRRGSGKPKPRHSAVHITVWSINGSPVSQSAWAKIEAAVEGIVTEERLLMQTVRV